MVNLPQKLIERLRPLDGFDEKAFIEIHSTKEKVTSIRLNPFKKTELDFKLGPKVKWANDAFYLSVRPSFTHDPLFHAGCYYVQEAGSMFLEHALKSVLNFSENLAILDLCAAPGGKSTLINSLLNENSLLVANEVVNQRAGVLAYNLSKWGTANTVVTNSDPKKFASLNGYFDALVIDAPCSGSGLFRKQPEAIQEWSVDNVNLCSARQKRIVADVLPALKQNGILVYSTCSYSVEENEENVKWLIKEFNLEYLKIPILTDWGIVESDFGYRFYPNFTQTEGFFCAILRKKEEEFVKNKTKSNVLALNKSEIDLISPFLVQNEHILSKIGPNIHLMSQKVISFTGSAAAGLHLKKAGISVGEIKGSDLVPKHDLALCNYLKKDNCLDLSLEESLKYLRKQIFSAPPKSQGFSLITYKKQGLGWAKILPNRVNNYLPAELRILN